MCAGPCNLERGIHTFSSVGCRLPWVARLAGQQFLDPVPLVVVEFASRPSSSVGLTCTAPSTRRRRLECHQTLVFS